MGYSAITMAQAALPTAQIVTFEKDFKWMLVAKRYVNSFLLSFLQFISSKFH
jgi:predicted O-methyltransferase YrrM